MMHVAFLVALVTAVVYAPPPDLPKAAVRYAPAKFTQALSQNSFAGQPFKRLTLPVPIADLPDTDWHQSGGMRGLKDVVSVKYRTGDAASRYAPIAMLNGMRDSTGAPAVQHELGIVRVYPDGTRFDDVLYYKGRVFEHRVRRKADGAWSSSVVHKDEAARPPGYTGLKVTCASCHNKAGAGLYGAGLNPGGDTVFSDPLDWSVVPQSARTR